MPDLSFIFALNAVATLMVGGAVYITGRKRLQSSVWLIYNTMFSIWNFCLYQALIQEREVLALFWVRASFIPLIFVAPVALHFLSIYSDREVFKNKIIGKIYLLFFLVFVLSFSMPREFIRGISPGAHFKYLIEPGVAFGIFAFIFIGFIFCGFYYLLRPSGKTYLRLRRNQRIWIFFGMLLGMLSPAGFLLAAYGIKALFLSGLFCVIPCLAVTGYAIAKYHVPEASVVFKKASLLAYSTTFIILMYTVAMYFFHGIIKIEYFASSIISGCIILINVLLTVHYGGILKLNKLADNVIYKKRMDYYKFLESFNAMIKEEKDLYTFLYYIVDSLISIIGVKGVMLYLLDEERTSFKLSVYRGVERKAVKEANSISVTTPLIDFLKEGNIFVPGESEKLRPAMPLRHTIPLYYGRDIVGLLNLGDKKGAAAYSREDIDILNAFGRELGICIDKAKLSLQAITDDLTTLYRYNYFHKRLDEELERSERYGRVFSLLLIDVDDFKRINDVFGHRVGDEVLKRTARIIKENLRKVDIAARYGGEEFAVILPETDMEKAVIAAERLRKLVEEDFSRRDTKKEILKQGFSDGARFAVTASIGISAYASGLKKDSLIKAADKALYRAKWEGKNRVCSG